MITLTELLDAAELHARNILVERQLPELIPLFHLCDAKGVGYIVASEFIGDTPDEVTACKDGIAAYVRGRIIERKIVAYSFLSEAWMIQRQHWDERVSTPPADCADRVEVVIATAQDRTDYKSRRLLIKRDETGKCVDLVLDPMIEGETPEPSGRFDNLLVES